METIVALHRNYFGEIINFVTSTGRVISYRKALIEAESGTLQGIQATEDQEGNFILNAVNGPSFEQLPNVF